MILEHRFTSLMTDHSINIVSAQNVLLWPIRRREDKFSINCTINCNDCHAKCPTVPQLHELAIGTLAAGAGQGSK